MAEKDDFKPGQVPHLRPGQIVVPGDVVYQFSSDTPKTDHDGNPIVAWKEAARNESYIGYLEGRYVARVFRARTNFVDNVWNWRVESCIELPNVYLGDWDSKEGAMMVASKHAVDKLCKPSISITLNYSDAFEVRVTVHGVDIQQSNCLLCPICEHGFSADVLSTREVVCPSCKALLAFERNTQRYSPKNRP